VRAGVTAEREVALPLADLPPGASTNVKVFGSTVAVFNVAAGRLFALGNNWPHHGGPLCHGRVSGTHLPFRPHAYRHGREGRGLACPWRSWEFDIQSG
jgi:nitrite reductase (NADH) small subunit